MNPRAMSVWIVAAASRADLALPERPGAGLLVAAGEERDQPDGLEQAREHGVEARGALAELGRFLGWQLGELGLELQVEAAVPAVDDADQRLCRERLELGRKGAVVGAQGLTCLDVREDALEFRRPRRAVRGSPDFA